jgi:hypothetical protein
MIEINKCSQINVLSENLEIKEQAILELLGYKSDNADNHVTDIVRRYIQTCQKIYAPKGGFVIKELNELQISNGTLKVENIILHIDRIVASQLKNSRYIALFICTIGPEIEQLYEKLFRSGDTLEGLVINLIGSEAAEATATYIHHDLKTLANRFNLNITNRFSPGYCNWNVEEQFKLFDFFPKNFCNISLTDSALMVPIKSVSGIMGIGENVKYMNYPCKKCKNPNCIYRRKKFIQ